MDRGCVSSRSSWTVGIAVLAVAVPAMAQQDGLVPFQQRSRGLEMASIQPSAKQPSSAGDQQAPSSPHDTGTPPSPGDKTAPSSPGSQTPPDNQTAPGNQATPGTQTTDDQRRKEDEQPGTSKNRLFGTIPDFLTVENVARIPPLTTKEKFDATFRSTFDWGQYVFCAGLAGIGQAQNADPSYGQGAVGYAKRFGLDFADLTAENFMTSAIVPSLLHQDPRYYRMGKGRVLHRMGYSVSRIFVTRSDTGHEQFNLSEIGGAFLAASLYNAYHPSSDRSLGNTLSSWVWQVGYDTVFIVIREFWPDIHRKFSRASK